MQRAFVLYFLTDQENNLNELNQLLSEGWKVICQRPMSGSQINASCSLVILEK
ncbi:hypothetical protein SAMN06295960_0996 [Paenibacillus aquistagni]|uniref:Uncharacterized protein n=1 Tax=Paenibacillus aquistagni TaxID=1852522 RepID=A0A1X7IXZ7_9BACL|nr:hypothetical protein SAMN06295960_0996 [Paenibacillus aquistagni]